LRPCVLAVNNDMEKTTTTPQPPIALIKPARLASLDALRGFDMLMIAGGGQFIELLGGKTGLDWVDTLAAQFVHPAWHGFAFYDFIFPLFLFLAGTSLPFSLNSGLAKGYSKGDLLRKVGKRMLILICLGILYKNAPLDIFDPTHIRYGSVLGRIGIATFLGAVLYLYSSPKQRAYVASTILILYYLAFVFIPVPGYGAGDFSFEGNLAGWFDRTFMPGRLLQKTYDELAMFTQLPAACLAIFGTFAGQTLLSDRASLDKIKRLLLLGAVGISLGLLWNFLFPINKHLWSSSFILFTSGLAFVMLAAFYWIIDVKGFKKWSFFFRVIGMNSLVMYLGYRFIDFNESSRLLFSGVYGHAGEAWHGVFNALGGLLIAWLLLYFLYRKKVFVKV
jgi:predicted acyltransferase